MRLRLFLIAFLLAQVAFGQTTKVSGVVRDSLTNERMAFVKVRFQGTTTGILTDTSGYFSISTSQPIDTVEFIFIGYRTKYKQVVIGESQELEVWMAEASTELGMVTVAPKENPAFRVLRETKARKKLNDPEHLDAYQCEVHNRMQFDVNNLAEDFEENKLFKKMDLIMDYVDTADGEKYLPILFSESISEYYHKSDPEQQTEIIKATRLTGVDYMQLGRFGGQMYQNVNVYENSIELFNKDFVSPISDVGRAFYKYKLLDNDTLDGVICYHIRFTPKRKGVAAFDGDIWITDSTYAVKKVSAIIPDDVNLNYVSDFKVEINYIEVEENVFVPGNEKVKAHFDLFNEFEDFPLIGAQVTKITTRQDYVLHDKKDFNFYVQDIVILDSADQRDEIYWVENRHEELNEEEQGVIVMVDSLKKNRRFKFYENLMYCSYTGFWRAGPIEVGNIFSMYNKNVVEGHRLMLSLRTSNRFSKKVEINVFGLYGFQDTLSPKATGGPWKYGASVRWKVNNSPREMLRFAYRRKIEQLGISSSLGDIGNSFSTLFSAGPLDKLTMVQLGSVSYEKDWTFDMRTFHAVEWRRFVPLGSSDYSHINTDGDTVQLTSLTSFQFRNQIMYTKDEKFLSGQFDRISLGSKHPIISLTHTWGVKDLLESQHNFHRFDLVLDHRPKVGSLGRIHYTIYAGKIFGTVPYPFLNVHQGNETYYLQNSTFNMLNYYEFISDEWIGVNFEHQLQGFIMDRVPLIRKLKMRLVYGAKIVFGRYDNRHNSEMLLPFYSYELSFNRPYYEASVGLENILKFIRVDAIWRLSYLDNVNLYGDSVNKFGVKFTFTSDF